METIKSALRSAGVYTFLKAGKPIYVGKASNLKSRLSSYLRVTDNKTKALHADADELIITPLRSEIEALIQESALIQKYRPRYNVTFKDDKSYPYTLITDDRFPRIRVVHKSDLRHGGMAIGPFTDSGALRKALGAIRRSFPYCTCIRPHKRVCINAQIGACSGFCCIEGSTPSRTEAAAYRRTIKTISDILRGNATRLQKKIEREIAAAVRAADYRAAAALRDRYYALDKVLAHRLYLDTAETTEPVSAPEAFIVNAETAECYDNSHLAGKEAVGACTAWRKTEDGEWVPDKTAWRTFTIRWAPTQDDPRMMHEMLSRRLAHSEWPHPDLIIIDGGITQFRAAKRAAAEIGTQARIISLAKPNTRVFGLGDAPTPLADLAPTTARFILHAIQETHNFVLRFHRRTRRKAFVRL